MYGYCLLGQSEITVYASGEKHTYSANRMKIKGGWVSRRPPSVTHTKLAAKTTNGERGENPPTDVGLLSQIPIGLA